MGSVHNDAPVAAPGSTKSLNDDADTTASFHAFFKLVALSSAASSFAHAQIEVAIPFAYKTAWNMARQQTTYLYFIYAVVNIFALLFVGRIADKVHFVPILVTINVGNAITTVLLCLASSFWAAAVAVSLKALFATSTVVAFRVIYDNSPVAMRPVYISQLGAVNILTSMAGTGSVSLSFIMPIRFIFLMSLIISLFSIWYITWAGKAIPFHPIQLDRLNSRKSIPRSALVIMLMNFLFWFGGSSHYAVASFSYQDQLGWHASQVALITLLFSMLLILSSLVVPYLITRLGDQLSLVCGCSIIATTQGCFAIFNVWPVHDSWEWHSVPLLIVWLCFSPLGTMITQTTITNLLMKCAPRDMVGRVGALSNISVSLALCSAPAIMVAIYMNGSHSLPFFLSASPAIIIVTLCSVLGIRNKSFELI